MRNHRHWPITILAAWAVAGCSSVSEKWDRFFEGTEPERAAPTVPPAPLGPDEALPGPRVVVLSLPGLPAERVERGMRDGLLPGFRYLRTRGTYARLEGTAADRAAADAALMTGRPPSGAGESYLRSATTPPGLGRTVSVALPVHGAPTVAEAVAAAGKRAVILRSFVAVAPTGARSLFGGAWPTLGDGTAPYTFASERDGARPPVATPGGVRSTVVATTGDRESDVLFVDVFGPARLTDGLASSTTLRVTASKDRARAGVIGSDDRLELVVGRWSRPFGLRFEVADGFALRGRSRLYLRPTGSGKLELFVEPADFDATRPPPWQPLSSPPEFVVEAGSRVDQLPRFSDALPFAALRDGVLSVRDAASRIEVAFDTERRTFERELLGGDYDLLHQSFALAEDAEFLGRDGGDEEVAFFGLQVPRERLADAAVARLDRLVRSALLVADSGRLGSDVTVLVVSGTGSEGWYAVNRRGTALTGGETLANVGALPAALLEVSLPAGAPGRVSDVGVASEPVAEVELRRTPRDQAELPTEFDLRGR